MTASGRNESERQYTGELPRHDWILLPLLSLLTVSILAGSVEIIARHMFPQSKTLAEDCMLFTDSKTGPRGIPNSVCWEKIAEGELTENRFNSCGHRAGMECGPKSNGVYRIVMIGTSMTMGMRVPRQKTFAASLPLELSYRTGNKVELYNEAIPYRTPDVWADHFEEVLDESPDLVLWALSPNDLSLHGPRVMLPRELNLSFQMRAWHHIKGTFTKTSFLETMQYAFHHTRTAVLLLDALYSDPQQYVKSSLIASDENMGYLRAELSRGWQERLQEFATNVSRIERQTKAAGIPLVVVMLPTHVQADMVVSGEWAPGFDPYKLDRELRSIITNSGGTYIDILPDIRNEPRIQNGYYALDVHPNPIGHAIISAALAKQLTSGVVAALSAPVPTASAMNESE
jgi:GDSL-like lipase/acylhydrolase family protein